MRGPGDRRNSCDPSPQKEKLLWLRTCLPKSLSRDVCVSWAVVLTICKMPRNPLPHPAPPPPCPPWLLESRAWRKHLKNYKRTLNYYRRYRLLLAKEKRMRAAAERECRQHAAKVVELQDMFVQYLDENFTPARTDPYCKLELQY